MIRRRICSTIRLAGLILLLATAFWAIRALAFQFGIHLSNDWQRRAPLPAARLPDAGDRILVLAPHSDDETLGCGGLIAMSRERGARVRVALVTNGDGFRIAVGRNYGTLRVTPPMCIRFAYQRQRETLRALKTLGLPAKQVTFLGYPDRGIAALWDRCWGEKRLYVSHATRSSRSPYHNSFTRNVPHCGSSLLADIQKLIRQERPTDIYIPHSSDNHSDHYATYCFVISAVRLLESEGNAPEARLHTYLVHRGDWPTPKGDYPTETIAPPHALASAGTQWRSLALPAAVAARKRQAIACYRTQTAMERGFLMSFARKNEVFGSVPNSRIAAVGKKQIEVDGDCSDWTGIRPVTKDPVGDYVVADFNKGGDVRAIYLASDGRRLYVRFDCVRNISRRITYTIRLRGLNSRETGDPYTVVVRPGSVCLPRRSVWAYRDNSFEVAVPLERIQPESDIFVQVRTSTLRLTVDNTGWQCLRLSRS